MNEKALLIGFRDSMKLAIYLDYLDNQTVYVNIGNESKMSRDDFNGLVNFMRVAKQTIKPEKLKGQPGIISPKSMAQVGVVWLQESGHLKIEHRNFIKVLSQENYLIFTEELEIATQNLDRFDKIQDMTPEARAAMGIDEAGRPLVVKDTLYTIRMIGYAGAIMLMLLDCVLLAAGIFNPILLYLVAIIALVIIDAYLLLPESEKKNLAMFWFNAKQFMNEDFWRIADGLPVSRKTVELFIVLLIVMTLMTAYFSKAIPSILSWGKKMFAGAPPESTGTEDVSKMVSFTRKGGSYYEVDKKFTGTAEFYKHVLETLITCRLSLKKLTATAGLGNNNTALTFDIDGEVLANNMGDTQAFTGKMRGHRSVQDAKLEKFSTYFVFKINSMFHFNTTSYFKRMKPTRVDKKGIDEVVMRARNVIVGPQARIITGTFISSSIKDKKVYERIFTINLKNFEQIHKFLATIEVEPSCLEILVEEIVADGSGGFDLKFRVIFVSGK